MKRPVELTCRAVRDLDRLTTARPAFAEKVLAKIRSLSDDATVGKRLVGPLKGIWSLRIGEYRVLYGYDGKKVTVLTVN